jgi:hypothetical protein
VDFNVKNQGSQNNEEKCGFYGKLEKATNLCHDLIFMEFLFHIHELHNIITHIIIHLIIVKYSIMNSNSEVVFSSGKVVICTRRKKIFIWQRSVR